MFSVPKNIMELLPQATVANLIKMLELASEQHPGEEVNKIELELETSKGKYVITVSREEHVNEQENSL